MMNERMRLKLALLAVLAGAIAAPITMQAQAATPKSEPSISGPAQPSDASAMPLDQLVTMTVHDAWVASGRDEDKFFAMVKQLADLSAQKRGITLPETEAAGAKAGAWIKKSARKDPNQLLYAVVDKAVQYVGKTSGTAAAAAPDTAK